MDPSPLNRRLPLFADVAVRAQPCANGGVVLGNALTPAPYPPNLIVRLRHWAETTPDSVFLGERDGRDWRTRTYAQVWSEVLEIARGLLPFGCSPERPLVTLASNSILHAELILAAMMIGAPVAPVAPAYAQPGREDRLREALALLTPGVVGWDDAAASPALGAMVTATGSVAVGLGLAKLASSLPASAQDVDRAAAQVGPDTIAKFLFTSGSTGAPKAVINTQRMLCSMQAALVQVWPFLAEKPPVLVDWLPWHHTFGGNHCFGIALYNGGAFYIDGGRPLPGHVARTIENLRSIGPTLHFNVPAGYEALLPYLEADPVVAKEAFGRLDLMFNAAAALPKSIRARLARLSSAPVVGSWGATETAPEATMVYFDAPQADNIGVPMPGVEIKLAPDDGHQELRVRGSNVTPGYWRDAEATARAFDDDGFYRSGDAARLVDPARPELGLLFDGRLAENFKLATGTWVNAGAVRLAAIHAARPLIADAVVAGHDRSDLGLLLFIDLEACRAHVCEPDLDYAAASRAQALLDAIGKALTAHNHGQYGATTRVARFLVLDTPPDARHGEVTAKGGLNQSAVLARRDDWLQRLYEDGVVVP